MVVAVDVKQSLVRFSHKWSFLKNGHMSTLVCCMDLSVALVQQVGQWNRLGAPMFCHNNWCAIKIVQQQVHKYSLLMHRIKIKSPAKFL